MRPPKRFIRVLAIGILLALGCSEPQGTGGSGGTAGAGGTGGGTGGNGAMGGDGGTGGTTGQEFSCTEQGIRDAIAKGGGPHYFDCDGAAPVVTQQTIIIDNSVILDGEGKLRIDGNNTHRVFEIRVRTKNVVVELRGLAVTGGRGRACRSCQAAGAILNEGGLLTLVDCTVSENQNVGFNPFGAGLPGNILSSGDVTIINSTVSNNIGGGVGNEGWLTITNSTVSGNTGYGEYDVWPYGVFNLGQAFINNSTISGSVAVHMRGSRAAIDVGASLIEGECTQEGDAVTWNSNGYNLESPGSTCGFDEIGDRSGITAEQLNLGPLTDNGGPTFTHKPGDGDFDPGSSAAIDKIPAEDCVDAAGEPLTIDQRRVERPQGDACDIGAVEMELTL